MSIADEVREDHIRGGSFAPAICAECGNLYPCAAVHADRRDEVSTKIQWTNETWNPLRATYYEPDRSDMAGGKIEGANLIGWHCERVSPGCEHCYAERLNEKRFGTGLPYNRKSRDLVDVYLDEDVLTKPLHWRKPRKVFVCSMTDLFGEWVPDEFIDRMFAVMALTPQHTYQVLTKRPERMREYVSRLDIQTILLEQVRAALDSNGSCPETLWAGYKALLSEEQRESIRAKCEWEHMSWLAVVREWGHNAGPTNPLPNVWLGTSVEDQRRADERIPLLLQTPAAVRFLSCEPLLANVSLLEYLYRDLGVTGNFRTHKGKRQVQFSHKGPRDDLHWVIVGGESGPGARPCNVEWIRSIVRQCKAAGVAVFVKQLGAKPYYAPCSHCTGEPHRHNRNGEPVSPFLRLRDRKGGAPEEWPADLWVREFPGEVSR